MQVLQRVVAERALSIYVHPVPPVLRETRHIVKRFNDLMRHRVRCLQALTSTLTLQ